GILLPKKDNLIIFESFLGKQYSDNPRALYEYLRSNYPSFQMIWSVERNSLDHFSNYDVRYVRRFSLRWLYLMNRSKYWLDRKSTRLNSSHVSISYAVFFLKKKMHNTNTS